MVGILFWLMETSIDYDNPQEIRGRRYKELCPTFS